MGVILVGWMDEGKVGLEKGAEKSEGTSVTDSEVRAPDEQEAHAVPLCSLLFPPAV